MTVQKCGVGTFFNEINNFFQQGHINLIKGDRRHFYLTEITRYLSFNISISNTCCLFELSIYQKS